MPRSVLPAPHPPVSPIVISVIAAIREDRQDDDRPQAQHWKKSLLTLLSVILLTGLAFAQDVLETMLPVTYVSVALIYVDGGRDKGVAVGDTLYTSHGKLIVDAVARASAAAHPLDSIMVVTVGEILVLKKKIVVVAQNQVRQDTAVSMTGMMPKNAKLSPPEAPSNQNRVSRRLALQYIGIFSSDSRLDFNQPTLLTRLEVENLYGSGVRFSMYGRTYIICRITRRGMGTVRDSSFGRTSSCWKMGTPMPQSDTR
jgi:hypothetical protein